MTIGILAQYLNSRNDVRDLINHLHKKCTVIIFLRIADTAIAKGLNENIEIRYFQQDKNKFRNYILDKIFKLFGKLPRSRNNYFITEKFKLQNSAYKGLHHVIEKLILAIAHITPKFISYQSYLSKLGQRIENKLKISIFFFA